MKNYASSILVLFIAAAFMCGFVGCEKLKISNLQANYHLKKANRLYTDESYKNATEEYELALELNPNLKSAYLYLGTSYSSLYRPMKTGERNKEYGDKAFLLRLAQVHAETISNDDGETGEHSYWFITVESKDNAGRMINTIETFPHKHFSFKRTYDLFDEKVYVKYFTPVSQETYNINNLE